MFSGDNSYLSYNSLQNAFAITVIKVEINPNASTGLILYNGQVNNGLDYIALLLRNGFVELHYDLGFGPTTIVSNSTISLQEWHIIEVWRNGPQGQLIVDNLIPAVGAVSQGTMLQLGDSLYLGGVRQYFTLPVELDIETGFNGCIRMLTVSSADVPISLISSAIDGAGIGECSNVLACLNDPCQNGATCSNTNFDSSFSCSCLAGFTGATCDTIVTDCADPFYCSNGGECFPVLTDNVLVDNCECSLPFEGETCTESELVKPVHCVIIVICLLF